VDLAKVTLGVRVVPPPPCAHTRTTFQTAWQSLQAASLTKKLRTVELSIRPESRRRQMPRHCRCGPNLTLAYQKSLSLLNEWYHGCRPTSREAGARRCGAHGAPEKPASADAAVSPMRASFTLPLTLGVPKFNRYRLNMMKGTTLDSGIVYLRGKSFQAFSISGTALQRAFKAV
jgi:hypothetical protein